MLLRNVIVSTSLAIILFWSCGPADAIVLVGDDRYSLSPADTVFDDLYMVCGGASFFLTPTIEPRGGALLDGTVTGDLWLAGGRYLLSGNVLGSLNTFSQEARVSGNVRQSARLFAQRAAIDGTIGNNLIAFAQEIELGKHSRVERDLAIFAEKAMLMGQVGRNVHVRGDYIIISGKIEGNLDLKANNIAILAPAEITGDIEYTCPSKIEIEDGVVLGGKTYWKKIAPDDKKKSSPPVGRIILFFCSLVTGLFLIPTFRQHTRFTVEELQRNTLVCMGIGLIFLCLAPVALIILLISVVGIPIGIILMFAYTIFFYISKIYVAILGGIFIVRAFRKGPITRLWIPFILGLIIISFLYTIPYFGWVIYFLVIIAGTGGLLRGMYRCRKAITPSAIV